uniref:ABC transporter permease n=1 Tax=Methanothermococcus thermolithotrophicus TaxID=2186 RepID=UPI0021DF6E4E|nr:hypothetical protein [Methanothermococcus thermolithotrophicus]
MIGAFFSLEIGYLIVNYLLKASLTLEYLIYVILGVLFGMGTSLISALYPAYKASKLDPIKALSLLLTVCNTIKNCSCL